MTPLGEWLTVTEAAALSKYHPERLRELIREGKIEARKFGPAWAVKRDSLQAYLEGMQKVGEKRGKKPKNR